MRVLKFGGSSISTPARVENVVEIIEQAQGGARTAVVVSAFGGVTDRLIEASRLATSGSEGYQNILTELSERHISAVKPLAPDPRSLEMVAANLDRLRDLLHGISLVRECSARSLDLVMSFGERLSASIISECLKSRGTAAAYLNASTLVKTDDKFGDARVNFENTNRNIQAYFDSHPELQIITGFIASTQDGELTTLGRSGSDYTAAIFAAALAAEEIEIWTDVDGVMTTDPRVVASAFSIGSMSYEEAMEMSHFGSKVVHPKAMQPAMEQDIPLRIRNTFDREFAGTVICRRPEENPFVIRGISSISGVALLRVQGSGMLGVTGISARLFGALARAGVNVILISQGSSEHSICLAVSPEAPPLASRAIEEEFELEILAHQIERVLVEIDLSVIAVVGENMRGTPGIAARIFDALGKHGANVVAIAQGSSELNISIVVNTRDETTALNAIHETFFVRSRKSLHLFLVGPGLVGGKLLEQVESQAEYLSRECSLDLHLCGLANSRKMCFDASGIDLKDWQKLLQAAPTAMVLGQFVSQIKTMNFRNSIFLDCTASDETVRQYERILNLGASIVTPNKRANSSSFSQYNKLKKLAFERGAQFCYETNVGASLPIISTLKDLTLSGDQILKIETIISGTISFIFNAFDGSRTFSEIVEEARERGFTEPDPRDDLNGMDVARKLLILAREVGLESEMSDVAVENILPPACQAAQSVEIFLDTLRQQDGYFTEKLKAAQDQSQVLRYIGTIEDHRISVGLQAVAAEHPFYHLRGSENVIAITTSRFREHPIVIKGPGAGADVTAAGVFSDVIRIGNS